MSVESADYGEARERNTYGNLAGRELLKERLKRVEGKLEKLDADTKFQIADLQHHVSDLQDRVMVLTLASEGYRKIRHRFIEVYRRDILDDVNKQGGKKIGEG